MQLFRTEVLDSRNSQWIGSLRLARPLGFSLITALAVICFGAAILLLSVGTVSRKVRLNGVLVPLRGTLQLVAPEMGVVKELKILEGEYVKAGQVLAIIGRNQESFIEGRVTEIGLRHGAHMSLRRQSIREERMLRQSQTKQRLAMIDSRTKILRDEAGKITSEAALLKRRLALARNLAERYQSLSGAGFVSPVQFEARQDEVLELTARLHALDRSGLLLERERLSLAAERSMADTQLQSDLLQLEREAGVIEQESIERSVRHLQVVSAPFAGQITARNVQPGQAVGLGQSLMALVPSEQGGSTLEAQLIAPSRTVGLLGIGQEVHIRYAAFPYQRYGTYLGHIRSISTTPVAWGEFEQSVRAPDAARQTGEPGYRVIVRIQRQSVRARGRLFQLKPGFVLEADIIEDTSSLWQLMLTPLLAAHRNQ